RASAGSFGEAFAPARNEEDLHGYRGREKYCGDGEVVVGAAAVRGVVVMEETTRTEIDTRCSRCGAPTAAQLGDVWICEDCYAVASSCCSGDEEVDEVES